MKIAALRNIMSVFLFRVIYSEAVDLRRVMAAMISIIMSGIAQFGVETLYSQACVTDWCHLVVFEEVNKIME